MMGFLSPKVLFWFAVTVAIAIWLAFIARWVDNKLDQHYAEPIRQELAAAKKEATSQLDACSVSRRKAEVANTSLVVAIDTARKDISNANSVIDRLAKNCKAMEARRVAA